MSNSVEEITQDQLRRLLSIRDAEISQAVKKRGLKKERSGKFNLVTVIQWQREQFKKMLADAARRRIEWSVGEIAAIENISVREINEYAKTKGFKHAHGVYDVMQFIRLRIDDLKRKLEVAKAGGEDALEAKRKEAMYDMLMKEMEYFGKAKLVINVNDIGDKLIPALKALQTKLLAMPRQVSPQCAGLSATEIEDVNEKYIYDCLAIVAEIPAKIFGAKMPDTSTLPPAELVKSKKKKKS